MEKERRSLHVPSRLSLASPGEERLVRLAHHNPTSRLLSNALCSRQTTRCAQTVGGTRGRTQLPEYVDKYLEGILKVDEFVSGELPLSEINEAFHLMHKGKAIRTVINMPHDDASK